MFNKYDAFHVLLMFASKFGLTRAASCRSRQRLAQGTVPDMQEKLNPNIKLKLEYVSDMYEIKIL